MSDALDRLAELAREDGPAPLDPARAARLVEDALHAARRRAPRRAQRRRLLAATAVGLLTAAAALALLLLRDAPAPGTAGARGLDLPGGDRITATPEARVQLASVAPDARRVRLGGGTALFDVVPLAAGQGFVVATDEALVEVRGTVFTVSAGHGRTVVRVYEGRVRVTAGGRVIELAAGETWSSAGLGDAESDPLAAEARAAVEARAAAAPRVTTLTSPPAPRTSPLGPPGTARPGPLPPAPAPTVAAPPAPAPADTPPGLDEVRGWISIGGGERALTVARERGPTSGAPGRWRLLEADALRALARFAEAADAYDAAAALLGASGAGADADAAHAGYLAAYLRLERLADAAGALASLDAARADAPGAPLEERALALRVRALASAGRGDAARAAARRYLARFPDGGQAAEMGALAGQGGPGR